MKAISLSQPYAWLVAAGYKTIETRTWERHHRGALLICASQSYIDDASTYRILDERGIRIPKDLEFGKALCIVNLTRIVPMTKDMESDACIAVYQKKGKHAKAWMLNGMVSIVPFDIKGQLGLFDVPDELISYVVERSSDGKPLMSMRQTILDFSNITL